MNKIKKITAREILDSRGHPTIEVEIESSSHKAKACVPSGASTGKFEAFELRDKDLSRFFGKGVLKACENVKNLSTKLEGQILEPLEKLDQKLIEWDGTLNKNRLGANTIMGVSLAYAKLLSQVRNQPLYFLYGDSFSMPVPLINVLNGGMHASNNLDVQEFMIIPHGFFSFKEALRASAEVFQILKSHLKNKTVGDEGGLAPSLSSNEEALKCLMRAIEKAGYKPGEQISLALDIAASSFFSENYYYWEKEKLSAQDLMFIYDSWIKNYPIKSIEDGLEEESWKDWKIFTELQGDQIQIVGDDLFVTHCDRLKKGINEKIANALLVKINQVGTLTETLKAVNLARLNDYQCILSHRSGETEDTSIADLSLAFKCGQIKTGGVCRGERTAKYNRLIQIEEELGGKAQYNNKIF